MSRYKPYPKYKDSGVEWLGEIPIGWDTKKLKFIATVNDDVLPDNTLADEEINYIDIGSVTTGYIQKYEKMTYANAPSRAKRIINDGDILVSTVRTYLKAIAPVPNKCDNYIASTGFAVIRPSVRLSSHFTKYALLSNYFVDLVESRSVGVSYPAINASDIMTFNIVLPPLKEQQAIANYLDKATKKIDTLIKKQERLIELLKEKRQAKVDTAIKDKQTQFKYLKYVVKQIFRPVNRVSNTEYEALGLYNRGRGLFHKPLKTEDELGDSDFYWVKEGDLILSGQFAWEGAVALASSDENSCIVSHRYPIIRGENNILDTEYLWAYLTTKEGDFLLNENSIGSAGRNRPLNMNTLMKEKIPVPSMKLQKEVATIVKMETEIKKSIATSISLLKERRNSLISTVVTGKIDVRFNK